LREGGTDSPVGISPADEKSGLAFGDVKRAAAIFRGISQDAAGVPQVTESTEPSLEVVIERSNFLPACFLETGARRSGAVCLVKASGTSYDGATGKWTGTGFLVSENILLTNHHVLNSPEVAGNAMCIFNFQMDEQGSEQPTKGFRVNPQKLFLTSPVGELDFTFVFVEGAPGKEFGYIPLDRSSFLIVKDEYANIIQHAAGLPKSVVLQESTVKWQDTVVAHYTSDTKPGSSGSCVFNNEWRPVALHHASRKADQGTGFSILNEGIKVAAIAAHLEKLSDAGNTTAIELLKLFHGVDSTMGFFGALGRTNPDEKPGVEAVVDSYRGESADIDVAFWNVEWLAKATKDKIERVADVIARMNLDIWSFEETAPAATEGLVQTLRKKYKLQFNFAHSEPDAANGKQSTGVIWNAKTVTGIRQPWPEEIEKWLAVRSQDFDDLNLEAVEGKVFDRYPALFHFSARNRDASQDPFDFYLVPLHLKAMAEGSKRRQMAAKIIAAAIRAMKERFGAADEDWVVGGDFNAELATGDFNAMLQGGLVALSASDAESGAMSYLKSPKSLIDHIFLSAHLAQTYGPDDYFIVAAEKKVDDYIKRISDHRPVLVRLSLKDRAAPVRRPDLTKVPESLRYALRLAPAEPAVKQAVPALVEAELEARAQPSDFDAARTINLYVPLLNASYDLAHGVPKPELPPGLEVLAEIRADTLEMLEALDELSPEARASLENDFRALRKEERPKADSLEIAEPLAFGFVVRETGSDDILVSVRGTQTPEEWVKDFMAIPNLFNEVPDFGLVHLGFEQMWRRIRDCIRRALDGTPLDRRITLIGHSLGAAMVTLGAVDLKRNFNRTNVDVCTFGGPRAGMIVFRRKFNGLIERCFRVVNQGDIVPHVPSVITGWNHVGVEMDVNGKQSSPHSLAAYLEGLKSIPGILVQPEIRPKVLAAGTH